jgi:uncharacterized membrane protein YccC
MTATTSRPAREFWRLSTYYDRRKVNLWVALRNSIGIVMPLLLGVYLGETQAGLVASVGALNVAAADDIDPYRQRGSRMLASCLVGAWAVFAGAITAHHAAGVIAGRSLWGFGAGLMVCLGTAAADLGMISLVVFIIYGAQSMPPEHAVLAGAIALGGGLFQTALSLAPWPLRGTRPERRLIGDLYLQLSRSAVQDPNPLSAPQVSSIATAVYETLASLAGDHRVESERLFSLASQAERIRLSLFALGRWRIRMRREEGGEEPAAAIDRFLQAASEVLSATGHSLHEEPAGAIAAGLRPAGEAFRQIEEHSESAALVPLLAEARHQVDTLSGAIRVAFDLSRNTTPAGALEFAERQRRVPWRLRFGGTLATLRANLSFDSSACRHGIRLASCLLIGNLIAYGFALPRSYWLAMTIALVLKPDFGSTFTRGALRLAGTYTGLLFATVLVHFVSPGPYVDILWIGLLALFLRSYGRANYGILSVAISAMIVFLFALSGIAAKDVIDTRALNTTIGGGLALAVYWVWPTRERTQAPAALATLLEQYRLYLQTVSRSYLDGQPGSEAEFDHIRTNARRARSNAETSADRLRAEPFVNPHQVLTFDALLASSHRFIHAVMSLEAGMRSGPLEKAPPEFRAFAHDLDRMLYFLAARLRGSPIAPQSLPDLRESHNRLVRAVGSEGRNTMLLIETDRMTNALNTVAEHVYKWAGTPEAAHL